MVPPLYIVLIVIVLIEGSSGIALNLYIVIVNLRGMKSRQKMKPCDLIHPTKGLVNVLLQIFFIMQVMIVFPWFQKSVVKDVPLISYVSLHTLGYFNYWLTAILCAYYCTAIANLRLVVFVWVKGAITTFLPQLLLLSAMGSLLFSIPLIWETSVTLHEQSLGNSTNDSMIIGWTLFVDHLYITVDFIGIYLPFILTLLSLAVTIFILVRHMWNSKDTNSNLKCSKLQAVINATRTMLLYLALYVFYYLSGRHATLSLYDSVDLAPNTSWFLMLFCPTLESLIIIQASSKLRQRFQFIVCCTETQRRNGGANN